MVQIMNPLMMNYFQTLQCLECLLDSGRQRHSVLQRSDASLRMEAAPFGHVCALDTVRAREKVHASG